MVGLQDGESGFLAAVLAVLLFFLFLPHTQQYIHTPHTGYARAAFQLLSLSLFLCLCLSPLSSPCLSPLPLQYHREFADPYWNSQEQNMITYLAMLMTSWAIVCDINYLNPTELKVSSCLECHTLMYLIECVLPFLCRMKI